MVKWVPKNVYFQNPYCQGKSWLLIASLRVSQRLTSGLNPGSFQITASGLGLKACEILCVSLKYKSLFPTVFFVIWKTNDPLRPSNPDTLGLVFLMETLQAGESDVGLRSLLLAENLCSCCWPFICGLPIQKCWLLSHCIFFHSIYLDIIPSLYLYL